MTPVTYPCTMATLVITLAADLDIPLGDANRLVTEHLWDMGYVDPVEDMPVPPQEAAQITKAAHAYYDVLTRRPD